MNEFDAIKNFFSWSETGTGLEKSVGDDCAILNVNDDASVVTSMDTLVEGIHFTKDTKPEDIAYKALAVNLSDIAAMGANPRFFTLSLTIPEINPSWLQKFSESLKALSNFFNVRLIGGDTTKGPLNVSISIFGEVKKGFALQRSGAMVGDLIFISGELGDAAMAFKGLKINDSTLLRLNRPFPRIELGQRLTPVATSCIDISDGLYHDLGHILSMSGVGCKIDLEKLPMSDDVKDYVDSSSNWCVPFAGGDDYELCFTAPKSMRNKVIDISSELNLPLTCIGEITKEMKFIVKGGLVEECYSYQHF